MISDGLFEIKIRDCYRNAGHISHVIDNFAHSPPHTLAQLAVTWDFAPFDHLAAAVNLDSDSSSDDRRRDVKQVADIRDLVHLNGPIGVLNLNDLLF